MLEYIPLSSFLPHADYIFRFLVLQNRKCVTGFGFVHCLATWALILKGTLSLGTNVLTILSSNKSAIG